MIFIWYKYVILITAEKKSKKVDEEEDEAPVADEDKEINSEKQSEDDQSEKEDEDDQPELPSGLTGKTITSSSAVISRSLYDKHL